MRQHTHNATRARWLVSVGLAAVVAAALVAQGCTPQTTRTSKKSDPTRMKVKVSNVEGSVTTQDIQYASYEVSYGKGGTRRTAIYQVAYVDKGGEFSILEGKSGFKDVQLTSNNIPERVKNYLEMGPIVGVVGARRSFKVGESYESDMKERDIGAIFRYTCDGEQKLGGMSGYHLSVMSARTKKPEMDLVLTPKFPFPLMVKEHTGSNPIDLVFIGKS
ncbi:MAG: hypothetical protein ACKVU1_15795 [bacterium]